MIKKQNRHLAQYRSLLLIVFGLLIGLLPLVQAILPDRTFSANENRALKTPPKFSLHAYSNGSFAKGMAGYLEDQFPFRDGLVSLKANTEKFLLRMENNDVYINNSEYLIDKFNQNPDSLSQDKAKAINSLARNNPGKNISVMLVPNKIEILKEKLPFKAPLQSQKQYLEDFYALLTVDINRINLIEKFSENKNAYLFFKTDHHWTQEGAFLASKEYLTALGLSPQADNNYDIRMLSNDFYGSLSSKAGIKPRSADTINVFLSKAPEDLIVNLMEERKKMTSLYQTGMVSGKDKYLLFLGGNYPVVRISTNSPANRRLLIIKDSYANAFVPFLTKDFNEITMLDLRYFTDDVQTYIEDYSITDILVLYNINTFNDDNSILNLN